MKGGERDGGRGREEIKPELYVREEGGRKKWHASQMTAVIANFTLIHLRFLLPQPSGTLWDARLQWPSFHLL